jgi:DNA/RNA endonuclease G (NUC1)
VTYAQPAPNRHLALGNPSGAVADANQPTNFLIARNQYALSYHRDRGIPTWVSWHLEASDLGSAARYSGPFITDTSLPDGWYRVSHTDYTGSGYDRGHMTPSGDRTASDAANQATFILTNILPQAPANNQGLWAQLEDHARSLVRAGNEVYLVSGGVGSRGTLADGRLTIPESLWKVMLVLPAADGDDAARVTPATQVIAIWTPNDASVQGRAWQDYQTSVRCVEQRTGLDFFSAVDRAVQDAIEGPGCSDPPPPPPPPDQRCFSETGQCIHGPIRAYWERNGGLAIFGFPITTQRAETVESLTLQVQWFERDRIEIQPAGLVTTGRLGVERLEQLGTPWQPGPGAPAGSGCAAFAETGHTVCGPFLSYWQTQGGLERFGFPVTGAFTMELEGRPYTVQFFERRRFELHPELGPNSVLLGLLGREVFNTRQAKPPVPAPPPAPDPSALPPSFNNCAEDPNAAAAPNYPVRITAIDKDAETVTLLNVSPEAVTLDGWTMCSVRGAQRHPIGGVLAPGEQRVFPGPPGNIWSNSASDPGALYDAAGRLVSYWPD